MRFIKYHGLGNDFIFIEDLSGAHLAEAEKLAKTLCNRHFGIGADGLVLITAKQGLYTMRIFNADGSEAEMCGNAIRCMGAYLLDQGLAEGPVLKIGTISGVKEVRVEDDLYIVNLGEPDLSFNGGAPLEIIVDHRFWTVYAVSIGNPHGVVFGKEWTGADVDHWGPRLENHSLWPNRANIEFVEVTGPANLRVKVWERGVGPTLACGTGAAAAAVISQKRGLTAGPVEVALPGGELRIEWSKNQGVLMAGPAVKVFSGVV